MKILFVTLSNVGDAILTLPVLDVLRASFPNSEITCITGPRPKDIFAQSPNISKLVVYDKAIGFKATVKLISKLRKENFDLVVDLRNSFFGMLIPAKHKTSPFVFIPKEIKHMRDRHLYRLKSTGLEVFQQVSARPSNFISLFVSQEDEERIDKLLKDSGVTGQDKIVVISAGARSHIKRWASDKFLELISRLDTEFKLKLVLVGDNEDAPIAKYIKEHSHVSLLDLTAKTNIRQLAVLLKKAACVISNDSAVMHLASYVNVPTVAIFGPTNEEKYGPWSDQHYIVKKNIFCRPCEKAQCRFLNLQCMQFINVEDLLRVVRHILIVDRAPQVMDHRNDYERILIVRTDRIGDVLLSTPVIRALRQNYPHAYIAMMVSPYAKDVVEGNPYLDEVIVYDKDGKHHSLSRSAKFSRNLKKKRFDLAIILHPTNRAHLVTFFAGIPRRVGYNRKLAFLLTDRIEHTKHLGQKHEVDYNLSLLEYLGIEITDKKLFMPIREDSEKYVDNLFRREGLRSTDKLLAIHPVASCPSKIWPEDRFAEVARKLAVKYGFKIVIVAGSKDMPRAKLTAKMIGQPVYNFAGKISVSQLASLLKRCALLISNDSGPVHIASAVDTPVISIFGRAQAGLGPKRWGPTGVKDLFLHKDVGCIECLAHNCVKEFTCLKAITVEDLLRAADFILSA